jgi:hypothetical protein
MIKKVMFIFVAVMLFGFVGKAQDLSGTWKNPGSVMWSIKQTDNVFYITASAYGNEYIGSGFKRSGKTIHSIFVCYKDGSVVNKTYDKLKIVDNNKIEVEYEYEYEYIEAGGGASKGQTDKEIWIKVENE